MKRLIFAVTCLLPLLVSCEKKSEALIVGRYEMRFQTDLSLWDDGLYNYSCDDHAFIMNRSFEKSTYYFDKDAAYLVFKKDGTWDNEGAMIYEYWGTWDKTGEGKYDYDITVLGRVPLDFRGICTMTDESITIYFGTYEYDEAVGFSHGQAYLLHAYNKE